MQVNKIETTKKLKMLEMQAEMLKTSKKKYDITDKEISSLADDTRYVLIHSVILIIFLYFQKPKGLMQSIYWKIKLNQYWLFISPLSNRVYSSVGRMFVLSTLPDVHTELVSKQSKCDDLLKSLDDKKEFLLKCSKEQEDSLRELVQQRKEATANWIK